MSERSDRKAIIRKQVKEAIAKLSPKEKKKRDERIRNTLLSRKELIAAKTVCIYVSRADEVDTRQVIAKLFALGKRVSVPRVTGDHLTIHVVRSFDDLEEGIFHILEPKKNRPTVDPSTIDLFIVPGVVFDRKGHRLGRGFGYFDKLLKNVTVPKIGLAYASQIIAEVPHTAYDVSVTALVTDDE